MGLKSKKVSSDDDSLFNKTTTINHDDQKQQQPLDCPRCGSGNTKFCYFNNYNKLQPRHFCKDCKRYWTQGGTLRNVPFASCRRRKNNRLKSPIPIPTSTPITNHQQPFKGVTTDNDNVSDILFEAFTTSPPQDVNHLSFSGGILEDPTPPITGIQLESINDASSSSITENYNSSSIFCQQGQPLQDHEFIDWWNLNDLDTLISVDDLNWDDQINP